MYAAILKTQAKHKVSCRVSYLEVQVHKSMIGISSKLYLVQDTLSTYNHKLNLRFGSAAASHPPLCNLSATITNALTEASTDDALERLYSGRVSHNMLHL